MENVFIFTAEPIDFRRIVSVNIIVTSRVGCNEVDRFSARLERSSCRHSYDKWSITRRCCVCENNQRVGPAQGTHNTA